MANAPSIAKQSKSVVKSASVTSASAKEGGALQPRRWTRDEYHRVYEAGIFQPDERLELLDGEIWKRLSPQTRKHFLTLDRCARCFRALFGEDRVQQQAPVGLDMGNEPEPDVAVLAGSMDDYPNHPTPADVLLIVEVSDSSLSIDRNKKAAIYAAAGIPDYWIMNLKKRQLEVRRDPIHVPAARTHKHRYQTVLILTEADTVSPLAAPQMVINVADLFVPQSGNGTVPFSP